MLLHSIVVFVHMYTFVADSLRWFLIKQSKRMAIWVIFSVYFSVDMKDYSTSKWLKGGVSEKLKETHVPFSTVVGWSKGIWPSNNLFHFSPTMFFGGRAEWPLKWRNTFRLSYFITNNVDWLIELRFYVYPTENRSFQSQPISWLLLKN